MSAVHGWNLSAGFCTLLIAYCWTFASHPLTVDHVPNFVKQLQLFIARFQSRCWGTRFLKDVLRRNMTKVGLTANNLNRSISTGFQTGMGSLFLMSQWERINTLQHLRRGQISGANHGAWAPQQLQSVIPTQNQTTTQSRVQATISYVCNYIVCI